jgi:hypothetical protein
MLLPLLLVGGYFVARKPPTKSESAAGTSPEDAAVTKDAQAQNIANGWRGRVLTHPRAASVGRPPLTVADGQYGFVRPMPGRPDGLGSEPGLGDNALISSGLGNAARGIWRAQGANGPDIFLRGPAVGVSDDNLALVRRRGSLE